MVFPFFEVFLVRLASQLECSWAFCILNCTLSFSSFCYAIFLFFDLDILLDLLLHSFIVVCLRSIDLLHFLWVSALITDHVLWHSSICSIAVVVAGFADSCQTMDKRSLYSFIPTKCQWRHIQGNTTNLNYGLLSINFMNYINTNEKTVLGLL